MTRNTVHAAPSDRADQDARGQIQAWRNAAVALLGTLVILVGCGTPGAPMPPTLALPTPVADLSASRTADSVHLTWTMPRRTTDKLPIKQPVTVRVCRRVDSSGCVSVGDLPGTGKSEAHFDDVLPPELATGTARLLTYTIEVRNRAGHSAGSSNEAFSASGAAPAAMTGFAAEVRADGVVLRWHAASVEGEQPAIRIHRVLVVPPDATAAKSTSAILGKGSPLAAEQTLKVPLTGGTDPGKALDPDAAFGQKYTYTAERVLERRVAGHTLEVVGSPSDAVRVETRDVFPPHTPEDLAVVTVPEEKAVDLSWAPAADKDLAGYFVYRREANGAGAPERISPATPILAPSFRDAKAEPGHTYAYSVSAVDQAGNESPRSAEVQETLPNAQP